MSNQITQPTFSDFLTKQKYKLSNWKQIGQMSMRHGPINTTMNMARYPWMMEFLKINGLVDRLMDGRTGNYREAIGVTLDGLVTDLTGLMDGLLKDDPKKLVMHQGLVSPELLRGMGLNNWPFDILTLLIPCLNANGLIPYIDASENEGIPSDVCTFSRSPLGLALKNAYPANGAPLISADSACDGQMNVFQMIGRHMKVPAFQMDMPHHFKGENAIKYYVAQIKEAMAFLEEHTPGRMDWDRLRDILEKRNRMRELELEVWDMLKTRPAPLAAEAIYLAGTCSFTYGPGNDSNVAMWEKLHKLCKENLENGVAAVPNEKYRTLLWNTWNQHSVHLYPWAEKKYGVTLLMDMMTYHSLPFADTSTPETMLESIARIQLSSPMARHTRGPIENFIDDVYNAIKMFDIDMVWFSDHIGCKNAAMTLGVLREKCREWGVPLFVYENDIMDPRMIGIDGIKEHVDDFMETVMKATPSTI